MLIHHAQWNHRLLTTETKLDFIDKISKQINLLVLNVEKRDKISISNHTGVFFLSDFMTCIYVHNTYYYKFH